MRYLLGAALFLVIPTIGCMPKSGGSVVKEGEAEQTPTSSPESVTTSGGLTISVFDAGDPKSLKVRNMLASRIGEYQSKGIDRYLLVKSVLIKSKEPSQSSTDRIQLNPYFVFEPEDNDDFASQKLVDLVLHEQLHFQQGSGDSGSPSAPVVEYVRKAYPTLYADLGRGATQSFETVADNEAATFRHVPIYWVLHRLRATFFGSDGAKRMFDDVMARQNNGERSSIDFGIEQWVLSHEAELDPIMSRAGLAPADGTGVPESLENGAMPSQETSRSPEL